MACVPGEGTRFRRRRMGIDHMIITRTPFRVSLFGGGTDYPAWFKQHGGAVIGTAIDKYCYLNVRALPPFFEHRHRIVYSKIELTNRIDEIEHPVVRCVLADADCPEGIEIHHAGDLPARAGLGSSSSFTVGLLNAMALMKHDRLDKYELARRAIEVEQVKLAEAVGCQDQVWAAYGGFNRIDFGTDGGFSVSPVDLAPARRDRLQRCMLLVFSGVSRYAHRIAQKQTASFSQKARELTDLRRMVDEAEGILKAEADPIVPLGALLSESWRIKRSLHPDVTTDEVDGLVDRGLANGAAGAKLLGAGGGGFVLFLCEPERRERLLAALADYVCVPVGLDDVGSIPIVRDPAQDL